MTGVVSAAEMLGRELAEVKTELRNERARSAALRSELKKLRQASAVSSPERLHDEHVRYLCAICGGRYREHHNHPCGRLVPVRVRITFIEEQHHP